MFHSPRMFTSFDKNQSVSTCVDCGGFQHYLI
uniref:Uncharacterized protein n=1 Tax=Arundo donax TaxID=35708 RepID=A0A0A9B0P1_ARUDO